METTTKLLEKVREERQKVFFKGKLRGVSFPQNSAAQELSHIESSDSLDIPSSWCWVYFGELINSIRSGSTAVPTDEKSNYPILRSSSVRPLLVDLQDIRFLTVEQSLNHNNFLEEGVLLFTRLSGSLDYVGNCAIVRKLGGEKIQYPDRLFCAKLADFNLSAYSELCFANSILRKFLTKNAKSSAGHQRISIGDITGQPIPLPPLTEQKEIRLVFK